VPQARGALLWTGKADGTGGRVETVDGLVGSLAWMPNGKTLACLMASQGKRYMSIPCGARPDPTSATEAYGPIAFSPDGARVYYGAPNTRGTLDLWVRPVAGGNATRLTSFARDTYTPSVSRGGRVMFGTQDYRVFVAVVPSAGGNVTQITAFQSETPSWSRDDRMIGVTYGTWRRIVDDAHYPDIAQDLGLVRVDAATPASEPARVVRASESEDQGLDWSPNGHWIVLHSHANGLDDVWIQPADGSTPARSITRGGSETGWPRWSRDGRWIAYSTQLPEGGRMRGTLFIVGVDSATGAVTREARRVSIDNFSGDVDQVEWSAGSDSLVMAVMEGADRRAIYVIARDGGTPRLVHRYTSEQQFSGVGVSPDFRWVAFVAPANDGHVQVYRVPIGGGTPAQVTFDPTDKTQPAVSRDGTRIAFTVFRYGMQFWLTEP
jgi:Tol biopolymer transport system component